MATRLSCVISPQSEDWSFMQHSLDFRNGLTPLQLERKTGEFIIPAQLAFNEDITVGEVLNLLSGQEMAQHSHYIYTLDARGRLAGVVSARQILFNSGSKPLKELASHHVVRIESHAPIESCLKTMTENELLSIPVTDKDKYLLGVFEIPLADLKSSEKTSSSKDFFQIMGLNIGNRNPDSVLQEYRYRMPWLGFNILGGLICAYIGSLFHHLLDEMVIVATFIPLMLTLGEAISMQSMALSLEFIRYKQIPWQKALSRLKSNGKAAMAIALTSSLLTSLAYYFCYSSQINHFMPMLAISVAIVVCMIAAAQIGAVIPIVLHLFKWDPKVASGPVALMLTDICVTLLYLSISTVMLML